MLKIGSFFAAGAGACYLALKPRIYMNHIVGKYNKEGTNTSIYLYPQKTIFGNTKLVLRKTIAERDKLSGEIIETHEMIPANLRQFKEIVEESRDCRYVKIDVIFFRASLWQRLNNTQSYDHFVSLHWQKPDLLSSEAASDIDYAIMRANLLKEIKIMQSTSSRKDFLSMLPGQIHEAPKEVVEKAIIEVKNDYVKNGKIDTNTNEFVQLSTLITCHERATRCHALKKQTEALGKKE